MLNNIYRISSVIKEISVYAYLEASLYSPLFSEFKDIVHGRWLTSGSGQDIDVEKQVYPEDLRKLTTNPKWQEIVGGLTEPVLKLMILTQGSGSTILCTKARNRTRL